MIKDAETPEAVAYNLMIGILAIPGTPQTRENILKTYRECLDLVKHGIMPRPKKPTLTVIK